MPALLLLAAFLAAAAPQSSSWAGVWTFDLCHEDRKASHDNESFCREGKDRILVSVDSAGGFDLTLCPADPWGERNLVVDEGGRRLSFRTRDNMDVRLSLGEDREHYRGTFRTPGGHSGRVWGRRVAGCG
ncbi:MAG TPA: hypothetical protein VFE84_14545 [Patescibacteria group bacterium]|jgi:hypothetical protein|nr:hypothetical protein [Patescibacteria group bacterium]